MSSPSRGPLPGPRLSAPYRRAQRPLRAPSPRPEEDPGRWDRELALTRRQAPTLFRSGLWARARFGLLSTLLPVPSLALARAPLAWRPRLLSSCLGSLTP